MRVRNVAVRELARRADVEHEESGRALPEPERIGGFDVLVGQAAEDRRALGRLSGGNCGEMRPRHAEAALEARPHVVEAPSERADLADALLERAEPPRQTPSGDGDAGDERGHERVEEHGRQIIALTRSSRHAVGGAVRAVLAREPGDERVLVVGAAPGPPLGPTDVRNRVRAAGGTRADLLQRQGLYPPAAGASPVLGLECAGEVSEVGADVRGFTAGQRVMALLAGGGYAEEAVVDQGSVLSVPDGMTIEEAGGFPEVFLTAFSNLFMPRLGDLAPGDTALVHGGGGGVGTAAILLLREAGHRLIVTAGSPAKCRRREELGATAGIHYRTGDLAAPARELAGGRGVDVVLDHIGGRYLAANVAALAPGGRLVEIGLMGGAVAELNLAQLLHRRLAVIGSTLRSRSNDEKAAIVEAFLARFGAALARSVLRPVVD